MVAESTLGQQYWWKISCFLLNYIGLPKKEKNMGPEVCCFKLCHLFLSAGNAHGYEVQQFDAVTEAWLNSLFLEIGLVVIGILDAITKELVTAHIGES